MDFNLGRSLFERLWVSAPASTQAADGLGPLYNARACHLCHINNGRSNSALLRLSIPPQNKEQQDMLKIQRVNNIAEPNYGSQLQDISIQGIKAEGQINIHYTEHSVTLADGKVVQLRKPHYLIDKLAYGPLHKEIQTSPRIAPPLIGLGLLNAIDEQDILEQQDINDENNDGISGKANRVWSPLKQQTALGRFGWKAGIADINEQVQAAFFNDIGLSTPLHPQGAGECTSQQTACLQAPNGNSAQYENLEAHTLVTDLVSFYTSHLAVPERRNINDPSVLAGKKLFYESGCTVCHTAKYTTKTIPNQPELSEQLIWPYTDLLLHDMGEGLADHRPEGNANGREWRTPPLWGIGLTATINGEERYLHDGRARTLLEAILWHGGEAQHARNRVVKMSTQQRENLLRFLKSL